ncbi:hypothetical protein [Deinococcus soli (ex Cha et al. 2016)]|uniref:Uncharacterized protein n=2 Tax=Deinococcus soli (ex Cha et al. 2016) TaxID=1309411 RepID=A0ACC6KGA5_9DEIO|nr:hypothetical protein [Deinococcus soli (ex Cha et al. 2016)]MDR6218443.1 hypothetical protein [Deinococcus soli (ex Cha et al. 2016)]MDR6329183.1 hypothetical protein [Deinococcus soli (ex Cha et al. 2016)]MDR6751456.1 hypothetical protein [Deinococcus soli (ex Cha et al. 2016)]
MSGADHRDQTHRPARSYSLADLSGDARRRAQENAEAFLDRGVRDGVRDEAARALLETLGLSTLEPSWDPPGGGAAVEGDLTFADLTASRAALVSSADPFASLWTAQVAMLLLSAREAQVPPATVLTLHASLRHGTYRTVVTADLPPAVTAAAQAACTQLSHQVLTRVRAADDKLTDPAVLSDLLTAEGIAFDAAGHVQRLPRNP